MRENDRHWNSTVFHTSITPRDTSSGCFDRKGRTPPQPWLDQSVSASFCSASLAKAVECKSHQSLDVARCASLATALRLWALCDGRTRWSTCLSTVHSAGSPASPRLEAALVSKGEPAPSLQRKLHAMHTQNIHQQGQSDRLSGCDWCWCN